MADRRSTRAEWAVQPGESGIGTSIGRQAVIGRLVVAISPLVSSDLFR
jgi:hypothetical protein